MTKEDIERKCLEYSQAATPSYTNGTFDRYAIAQAFEDGAEWRINSVWHDASEIPDLSQDILIISLNEICTILIGAVHTLSELKHYDYTNWAYVKDLIPIKEDGK